METYKMMLSSDDLLQERYYFYNTVTKVMMIDAKDDKRFEN